MGYGSGKWIRHKDGHWEMTVSIDSGKKINFVNEALDYLGENTSDFLEFHYPELWYSDGWGGQLHLTWGWAMELLTDEGEEQKNNPPDISSVLTTAFSHILEGR